LSEFSKIFPNPKKLTDFKDILNHLAKMCSKFTTEFTSTTMFLSQNFIQLNLSSTTLNAKLHSLKKLDKLGKMLPPPNKLSNSKTALKIGQIPTSS